METSYEAASPGVTAPPNCSFNKVSRLIWGVRPLGPEHSAGHPMGVLGPIASAQRRVPPYLEGTADAEGELPGVEVGATLDVLEGFGTEVEVATLVVAGARVGVAGLVVIGVVTGAVTVLLQLVIMRTQARPITRINSVFFKGFLLFDL